jgi:hypothetical protein
MKFNESPIAVVFLAAILFIPFLGAVHLFDWDEVNFAESAREMLVTGDYFRVQINYQPFWEKPPLFFWLQALSMSVFGINEFAARFPNAICGILTLTLLFKIGKEISSPRLGWLWVLFMLGSFTPALYFKSGIIDPWFNLFIFFAIWQLNLASQIIQTESRTKRFIWIGISLGLAVLTKGPVALLVVGLCVLVFWVRNAFYVFFTFKQVLGCVLCILGISSLWLVVEIGKNGFGVLQDFIAYQVDLFLNPVAGHGQPWYYHPVVLWFGCIPASILSIQGFLSKSATLEKKSFKQWMSILFWVVLILFSIVTTKIVHYSSLCWMPLTFMAAFGVEKPLQVHKTIPKIYLVLLLVFGGIMCLLLSVLPLIEYYKHLIIPLINDSFAVESLKLSIHWSGYESLIGLSMLVALIVSVAHMWRGNLQKGIHLLLAIFMLGIPTYLVCVVPKIEAYSQRPAIEFFQSLEGKDCYVETIGMKSYAQYFYPKTLPYKNPLAQNPKWIVHGKIDKPVFCVSKISSRDEVRSYGFTELYSEGGFVFWVKMPPSKK